MSVLLKGESLVDEKIIELLKKKEFVKKIVCLKSKEEVKKAFESEKVKISDEDLNSLGDVFCDVDNCLFNLDDKELKNITGGGTEGSVWDPILKLGEAVAFYLGVEKAVPPIKEGVQALNDMDKYHSDVKNAKKESKRTVKGLKQSTEKAKLYNDLGVAGISAVTCGVLLYSFRSDIKKWFRK